jgi:YVTN family beta-propeller protein
MTIVLVAGIGLVTALNAQEQHSAISGEFLPTGVRITPEAAEGAIFRPLNPGLPTRPDFLAGQAVTTAVSPDGHTLLILTSGYNRNNDLTGKRIAEESNEYVFVYDISGNVPVRRQVLHVSNTFNGLAWHPSGQTFYVAGGVDDNVHVFERENGLWREVSGPISLGHPAGQGLDVKPMAAGLAVNASGTRLLVANFANDSVSVIDLTKRAVVAEVDLRPGKVDPARQGVAGGEYPFWIAMKGDHKAYVSSQRDREVVVARFEHPRSHGARAHHCRQPTQ